MATSGHVNSHDDANLFAAFMEKVKATGATAPEQVAVPGISARQLRRYWTDGMPSRIEPGSRDAMRLYLSGHGERVVGREAIAEVFSSDLMREIAKINGSDLDEAAKDRRIEAMAAAYRGLAMERAEEAAVKRAEAARLAEENARDRQRGISPSGWEQAIGEAARAAYLESQSQPEPRSVDIPPPSKRRPPKAGSEAGSPSRGSS